MEVFKYLGKEIDFIGCSPVKEWVMWSALQEVNETCLVFSANFAKIWLPLNVTAWSLIFLTLVISHRDLAAAVSEGIFGVIVHEGK
jgi:hypothetical protein